MPETLGPHWFGVVLSVILGYLQSICQQQPPCGGCIAVEQSRFNLQMVPVYFTIALTASTPPPPSYLLKITLLLLILGFASLLASAVPKMLNWVPYFSCIRPFFQLLPHQFQVRILQFVSKIWNSIERLMTVDANPDDPEPSAFSSSSQDSLNLQEIEVRVEELSPDVSVSLPSSSSSSSSQTQLNLRVDQGMPSRLPETPLIAEAKHRCAFASI